MDKTPIPTTSPTDGDIDRLAEHLRSNWVASGHARAASGQIVQTLGQGRSRVVAVEHARSRRRPGGDRG